MKIQKQAEDIEELKTSVTQLVAMLGESLAQSRKQEPQPETAARGDAPPFPQQPFPVQADETSSPAVASLEARTTLADNEPLRQATTAILLTYHPSSSALPLSKEDGRGALLPQQALEQPRIVNNKNLVVPAGIPQAMLRLSRLKQLQEESSSSSSSTRGKKTLTGRGIFMCPWLETGDTVVVLPLNRTRACAAASFVLTTATCIWET